jgi:hypothetical protein
MTLFKEPFPVILLLLTADGGAGGAVIHQACELAGILPKNLMMNIFFITI